MAAVCLPRDTLSRTYFFPPFPYVIDSLSPFCTKTHSPHFPAPVSGEAEGIFRDHTQESDSEKPNLPLLSLRKPIDLPWGPSKCKWIIDTIEKGQWMKVMYALWCILFSYCVLLERHQSLIEEIILYPLTGVHCRVNQLVRTTWQANHW